VNIKSLATLMQAYVLGRRTDRIADFSTIQSLQTKWLARLRRKVVARSAFYRPFARQPFEQWPIIDKALWMERFDDINIVGARLSDLMTIALQSEKARNFSAKWHGFTVGLSTGTSGHRGLYFVSGKERAAWAGVLLGKLLTGGLFAHERIALVLRAGSTLYDRMSALRLQFLYVDQAQPWGAIVGRLEDFDPTILVAPARVLRLLAESGQDYRPRRVISVAEVLDDIDRTAIERAFGVQVEQIYQATEGLLGTTCERGTIHLNEPYIIVEKEWIDAGHTRFVPIVTDLWRTSQPVIRYRMNDVLRVRPKCECGRAATAIAAIDGRVDDILWLEGPGTPVPIFPDLLSRLVICGLSNLADYEVVEQVRGSWRIGLRPLPAVEDRIRLAEECSALAKRLGAYPPQIEITEFSPTPALGKQRRVRGTARNACVS
jgi:putative adenylate-forming enzyme